tara:strand:+ start:195 stop:767 length:573 start_codon:yes stop_codon:yes gene_type:complete
MHKFLLVWALSIALVFGNENKLNNFYKLLDQGNIIKIDINFIQKQFENSFNSSGSFYLLNKNDYCYDSPLLKIITKDNVIMTINYETNQVVYSAVDSRQVGILDILSGNKKFIKFTDDSKNSHIFNFAIHDLGHTGFFEFDENTEKLKMVKLEIGDNQIIIIEITSINIINDYIMPTFDKNIFEIIDLRG